MSAAASLFSGSDGFGYVNNCGRKTSKTLTKPIKIIYLLIFLLYIGVHVSFITSRHTDPDDSSTLGCSILFINPIEGDANG